LQLNIWLQLVLIEVPSWFQVGSKLSDDPASHFVEKQIAFRRAGMGSTPKRQKIYK
jgi:hypothetical protein